ncbi:glycosyltransferase family 2 protein [Nocardia jejuensis]|uniref:glycosyltransferase family 2 protein n=1 Tax=Nocardia jejuensis TaxID=328049 RepID=UPI001FE038F5|nr:glycosyltransferase [Nocardia jejuensis]
MANLSVCVPVRNSGRALATTLRSILDQDIDFEVIVLDNASTDDTRAVAESFQDSRIRVVRNELVLPIGENWNKAVSLSSRRLVKVISTDDLLLPCALDQQVEIMGDNGIAVCSARYRVIDEQGVVERGDLGLPSLLGPRDARTLLRVIVRRGPSELGPVAAAIFRRADFDRVGGFRGDLLLPMDVDLLARLSAFGQFFGLPQVLFAWRSASFARSIDTSGVGTMAEMVRFHHRLGAEYPQLLGRGTILGGDLRLARVAAGRVRGRAVSAAQRLSATAR